MYEFRRLGQLSSSFGALICPFFIHPICYLSLEGPWWYIPIILQFALAIATRCLYIGACRRSVIEDPEHNILCRRRDSILNLYSISEGGFTFYVGVCTNYYKFSVSEAIRDADSNKEKMGGQFLDVSNPFDNV